MLYSKKIAAGAIMAGTLVIGSLSGTAALASNAPANLPSNSQISITAAGNPQNELVFDAGNMERTDEKTITLADGTVLTVTWAEAAVSAGQLKLDPTEITTDSGDAVNLQISSSSFMDVRTNDPQPGK